MPEWFRSLTHDRLPFDSVCSNSPSSFPARLRKVDGHTRTGMTKVLARD